MKGQYDSLKSADRILARERLKDVLVFIEIYKEKLETETLEKKKKHIIKQLVALEKEAKKWRKEAELW